MKKILFWIFSAVLAVAVAMPTTAATVARKAGLRSGEPSALTATASASREKMTVPVLKTRSLQGADGILRSARSASAIAAGQPRYRVLSEGAELPDLQGIVIYNSTFTQESAPAGLYKVNTATTQLLHEMSGGQSGAFLIDGKYYLTEYTSFWGMVFVYVNIYDAETGEELASVSGEIDNIIVGGVYVPAEDVVYGVGYNAEGSGLQFAKYQYSETGLVTVTPIADFNSNINSMAVDAEGQLYAITYTGHEEGDDFIVDSSALCKLDKATGALTEIGQTGVAPLYLSSSCIDPKTGKMYWDVCPADETSTLYEVNLTTGALTAVLEYTYSDEVMGLHIPQPAAEAGAPAAPENLAVSFPDGALVGTVEFDAPSTLFDGTAASGELSYKVLANGAEVATGTTAFAAHVSVPVTLTEAGEYDFVVTVSNAVGASPKAKTKIFVGNGVPAAPEVSLVYADGKMNLSWEAVTTTVDGGYINPAAVTYTVTRVNDATVVAQSISATSFSEEVAEPAEITSYSYSVRAESAGLQSLPGVSNSVVLGAIVPPYSNDFSDEEALAGFTILDENGDGKGWMISGGALRMAYNSSLDMDDWCITPPMKLEAGKAYTISFDAYANGTSYPERVEAKWGSTNSAAGMTNDLIPATVLNSKDPVNLKGYIVPETTGTYFIGIHGISDPDMFYLYVDNLEISAGMSADQPGAATDIVVTPDPAGALKATISFKAPAVNFAGAALTELTSVVVKRGDAVIKTFENPAIGAELSCEDTSIEASGEVTYTVQGFNSNGEGIVASASAYVGFDVPAAPETVNITETETLGQVMLTWDPVLTDVNGLTYPAGSVTYLVAEYNNGWQPISDPIAGTSYTFQAVEEYAQDFVQYAIFPQSAEGIGSGTASDLIVVGFPYYEMTESFPNGTLDGLAWATGFSVAEASWTIADDSKFSDLASQDGDNGFALMQGRYLDSACSLMTAKISLEESVNPGISFYTYNIINAETQAPDINEINLYVREVGTPDWVLLSNTVISEVGGDAVDAWVPVVASLSAYAGKTIQVRFEGVIKHYTSIMIDNIKVGSMLNQDVKAVSIAAPANVVAGADFNVDVTVLNNGIEATGAFTVNLLSNWEVVATENVETLVVGESKTISFPQTMSAVASEPVTYMAMVYYENDQNTENNNTENIFVTPKHSNLPVVQDLKGENVAEGVKLTWNEPNLEGGAIETVTENFENCESWAHELEGWTFVDVDNSPVGGFQNTDVPGITPGSSTASFFVFDCSESQFNQSFAAQSGSKYLAALFRYDDGTTSDWAISPALSGNAQTISFYARSYSSQYPESLKVFYSTGSLETTDFIELYSQSTVPGEWTLYNVDLPAGAQYFAINSCGTSSFMLMVDDVTFERGSGTANLELKGYDVYRDGVKLNTELVGETEFIDTTAEADEFYTYSVVAVYDRGVSAPESVEVECSGLFEIGAGISVKAVDGNIVVLGAEGQNLVINAIDGKVVFAGKAAAETKVAVAGGVYTVKVNTKVVKIIVR